MSHQDKNSQKNFVLSHAKAKTSAPLKKEEE